MMGMGGQITALGHM